MKKVLFLAAAILMICLASCTMMKVSGRGSLPLVFNNLPAQSELIKHFEESKFVAFDYSGAVDVSEILTEVLANAEGADAITNITLEVKGDAGTFFVNLFTIGIANARRVEITGDLIKLKNGFSDLKTVRVEDFTLNQTGNFQEVLIIR